LFRCSFSFFFHAQECNYGTGAIPFDSFFGTFRASLAAERQQKTNRDEEEEAAMVDTKATLTGGPPSLFDGLFYIFAVAVPALILFGALANRWGVQDWRFPVHGGGGATDYDDNNADDAAARRRGSLAYGPVVATIVAAGPIAAAALLHAVSANKVPMPLKKRFLAPFHEGAVFGSFGFHSILVAGSCVVLPIYQLVLALLSQPDS
jgi:hypothetical protein